MDKKHFLCVIEVLNNRQQLTRLGQILKRAKTGENYFRNGICPPTHQLVTICNSSAA